MEWISVKDELPNELDDVLCTDGENIDIGHSWKNETIDWVNELGYPLDGITHWMPLPELPEK